jgi:predicted oxidoreductase
MGMSVFYGTSGSDEDRFVVLDKAIEIGETIWDSESSILLRCHTSSPMTSTLSLSAADMYGDSEEMLGRYFKARPDARAKVFLATKFSYKNNNTENDSSPEYLLQAIESSLRKLGTNYVDLYYW